MNPSVDKENYKMTLATDLKEQLSAGRLVCL